MAVSIDIDKLGIITIRGARLEPADEDSELQGSVSTSEDGKGIVVAFDHGPILEVRPGVGCPPPPVKGCGS